VIQVKEWVKNNSGDIKSVKFIEWGNLEKTSSGSFLVRVRYATQTSTGIYTIKNKIFFLDSTGTVIKQSDLDQ
jgi:hypothetical protein